MEFLHLFDDLDVVQDEKDQDLTLFRYKPKYKLMVYDRENGQVYVSYEDIWIFLKSNFGLNRTEIQELIKEWLDEVYNLRGVTPTSSYQRILPVG
jgi:DNA-binding transcriptional ArsR family regulator